MKKYKYNYRNRSMDVNIKITNKDIYSIRDKFGNVILKDKDIVNIQYIARGNGRYRRLPEYNKALVEKYIIAFENRNYTDSKDESIKNYYLNLYWVNRNIHDIPFVTAVFLHSMIKVKSQSSSYGIWTDIDDIATKLKDSIDSSIEYINEILIKKIDSEIDKEIRKVNRVKNIELRTRNLESLNKIHKNELIEQIIFKDDIELSKYPEKYNDKNKDSKRNLDPNSYFRKILYSLIDSMDRLLHEYKKDLEKNAIASDENLVEAIYNYMILPKELKVLLNDDIRNFKNNIGKKVEEVESYIKSNDDKEIDLLVKMKLNRCDLYIDTMESRNIGSEEGALGNAINDLINNIRRDEKYTKDKIKGSIKNTLNNVDKKELYTEGIKSKIDRTKK